MTGTTVTPVPDTSPGRPRRTPPPRRAATVPGALGVTLLGALLPGAGLVWSRRRLGLLLLVPALVGIVLLAGWVDLQALLQVAFDPGRLRTAALVAALVYTVWAVSVVATYLLVRPDPCPPLPARAGLVAVCLGVLVAGLPIVQGIRYTMTQADLVTTVFSQPRSATTPADVSVQDPWGGRRRVNVLVLGGDGSETREGVRTDTVILLSMDTHTGQAVMFSLPRNMMNAQFPPGSALHEVFPQGFRGEGDPGAWMLNAVYGTVPQLHPGLLSPSDNEGADAVKQAVAGSLGTRVDYYVMVNLAGFKQIVDAMGGVTVNINERVAIGGDTDAGVPPDDWLEPGPDQHLDGYHALWFARGRWGSDDYQRMLRQRCLVDALIAEADPLNLVRRYRALAEAGKDLVLTDVPGELMPAFVNLALKVKSRPVKSVAFVSSERFFSGDPDFAWMRSVVDRALRTAGDRPSGAPKRSARKGSTEPPASASPEPAPGESVTAADSCAYRPSP